MSNTDNIEFRSLTIIKNIFDGDVEMLGNVATIPFRIYSSIPPVKILNQPTITPIIDWYLANTSYNNILIKFSFDYTCTIDTKILIQINRIKIETDSIVRSTKRVYLINLDTILGNNTFSVDIFDDVVIDENYTYHVVTSLLIDDIDFAISNVNISLHEVEKYKENFTRSIEDVTSRDTCSANISVSGQGTIGGAANYEQFLCGSSVALTAYPSIGNRFLNWSGSTFGTGLTTSYKVDSRTTAIANFVADSTIAELYTLTLSTYPSGQQFIITGASNGNVYTSGTNVQLVAYSLSDTYRFSYWSGDVALIGIASGDIDDDQAANYSTTITMNRNCRVTANFVQKSPSIPDPFERQYTLSVKLNPYGVTVGLVSGGKSGNVYAYNDEVSLLAMPFPGYKFFAWSGDIEIETPSTGGENPYDVDNREAQYFSYSPYTRFKMLRDSSVTANFLYIAPPIPDPATKQYTFSVRVMPNYIMGVIAGASSGNRYNYNEVVSITAVADANYRFFAWSGDVDDRYLYDESIDIVIKRDTSVIANFVKEEVVVDEENPKYRLRVTVPGGGGTVGGTTVGGYGELYDNGSIVRLGTTPNIGYRFSHWSGSAFGNDIEISVTMDRNKDISANFVQSGINEKFLLKLSVLPDFTAGTISGSTVGGTGESYDSGAIIRLVATPNPGYSFSNWVGSAYGEDPEISVTMDRSKDIKANFIKGSSDTSKYYLKVTTAPLNTGTIGGTASGSPGDAYLVGSEVEIIATPNSGYEFSHWSGSESGTEPTLRVIMNMTKDIVANMVVAGTLGNSVNLQITIVPPGAGTVSGATNNSSQRAGTIVHLLATPSSGGVFVNWGGDISSSSSSYDLTMNSDKNVIANFGTTVISGTLPLTCNSAGPTPVYSVSSIGDGKIATCSFNLDFETDTQISVKFSFTIVNPVACTCELIIYRELLGIQTQIYVNSNFTISSSDTGKVTDISGVDTVLSGIYYYSLYLKYHD